MLQGIKSGKKKKNNTIVSSSISNSDSLMTCSNTIPKESCSSSHPNPHDIVIQDIKNDFNNNNKNNSNNNNNNIIINNNNNNNSKYNTLSTETTTTTTIITQGNLKNDNSTVNMDNNNQCIANHLRQSFFNFSKNNFKVNNDSLPVPPFHSSKNTTTTSSSNNNNNKNDCNNYDYDDDLERRGRIIVANRKNNNNNDTTNEEVETKQQQQQHAIGLYWHDTNRISSSTSSSLDKDTATTMTIQQMVLEERMKSPWAQAEEESRNILRYYGSSSSSGMKRCRPNDKNNNKNDNDDDEIAEYERITRPNHLVQKQKEHYHQREVNRQIAHHDAEIAATSHCWWWIECKNNHNPFQKRHQLIAVGDHVTLVMAPISITLPETFGLHFYLVPIRPCLSLASCDDNAIWNEIRNFQNSLRMLFQSSNNVYHSSSPNNNTSKKTVLFYETVRPTQKFWQTKLECVALPETVAADAQLYFKSALTEMAEEWGTHQKLIATTSTHSKDVVGTASATTTTTTSLLANRIPPPIHETTRMGGSRVSHDNDDDNDDDNYYSSTKLPPITKKKDLRRSVPNGFSYFYVEYGDNGDGYVQIIESHQFPKDFGIDTIAGMLKVDPLRLRRDYHHRNQSQQSGVPSNDEKRIVREFLSQWKKVDWTVQLDSSK